MCQRRHAGSFCAASRHYRHHSMHFIFLLLILYPPDFCLSLLICLLGGSRFASCTCDHFREVSFILQFTSPLWNQSRNPGDRDWRILRIVLLPRAQLIEPRIKWHHHSGLGPPTSCSNQERAPWICLQSNLMEAIPQEVFPGDSSLYQGDKN